MFDYWVHVTNLASIYILLTVSLNLLVGYTGLFTVTHGALFGVGGYASALVAVHYGVPLLVAILVAIGATAVIGSVIALPSLRISGDYLVIASIAIQVLMVAIFVNADRLTGGASGLAGIPQPAFLGWAASTPISYLPLNIVGALVGLVLAVLLVRSPFGRTLRAIREDEVAAASLGKDIVRYKFIVYLIASGMALSLIHI